ncbi:MAG TPA: hypothetical protein VFE46_09995 [Pirellulales bacterium]|jgi:hypothetical protein|nr:hypothetical protein [Pirellulales bacterium]
MQKAKGRKQNVQNSMPDVCSLPTATRSAGRLRFLPSAFCILPSRPCRGISLMEVLISIGIMAVGLLSIASLIPVGGVQANRANIEERKATLGQNAYREFQIRGMANPQNWVRFTGANWGSYLPLNNIQQTGFADFASLPPLVIDPLMLAAGHAATLASFPAMYQAYGGNLPGPRISRIGVSSTEAADTSGAISPSRPLAEGMLTAADDVLVNRTNDNSQPGTSAMIYADPPTNSLPLKRDYGGLFTWLAVLTPNLPYTTLPGSSPSGSINIHSPQAMDELLLSIVIFNRRIVTAAPAPATNEQGQEEMVAVHWGQSATLDSTQQIGGGEFTLTDNNATGNATGRLGMVQPNQWIMLCRYLPYTFTYTDSSSGLTQSKNYPWLQAKWYRVVAAGDTLAPTSAGSPYTRQVTLTGPDWEADPTAANNVTASLQYVSPSQVSWPSAIPSNSQNFTTYAIILDGAVGVYQRVIHLEGASAWSQ